MTTWKCFFCGFLSCWFPLKVTVTSECCPVTSARVSALTLLVRAQAGSRWPWLSSPGWAWIRYQSVRAAWGTCATATSTSQCQRLVTCRHGRMRTGASLEKEASCGLMPSHTGSQQQPTFNTELHDINIWSLKCEFALHFVRMHDCGGMEF